MFAGSAPRVRGTQPSQSGLIRVHRFSPAGAGNASCRTIAASVTAVQPRGCGERWFASVAQFDTGGSAPRVRGTLFSEKPLMAFRRFSPAGAGNARRARPVYGDRPVQPRGCGERLPRSRTGGRLNGSAPRVRGTHCHRAGPARRSRFSPAGAGNALIALSPKLTVPVQPRGCGERILIWIGRKSSCGSAPRVRGTQSSLRGSSCTARFSPAGAGNARPKSAE